MIQCKAKILIVDDDPLFRQAAAQLMLQSGYEVVTAATGQEGLSLARAQQPQLVLLSAGLLDEDWREGILQFKADPLTADWALLLVSDGPSAGPDPAVDGYVRRDMPPHELLACVRNLVCLSANERALRERVKELKYVYGLSTLVEAPGLLLDQMLQGAVELFPAAWQYAEVACARIVLEGREYRTDNFRETSWKQAQEILVQGQRAGTVEIYYLEERPAEEEGPFLLEERSLLNAVAERLGRIVERVQAEQALQESQSKLQTLWDILPIGISILDHNYNVVEDNAALHKILDISAEELAGHEYERRTYLRPDGTIMPAEEFPSRRAQEEGQAVLDVEVGIVKEDGQTIWTSVSAVPVSLADWKVVITTADVTGRKQAEEALRQSEYKFRSVVEQSQDGIALTDEGGRVIEWNRAMERITGLPAADVLGRLMWDVQFQLVPAEQQNEAEYERFKKLISQCLRTGQAPWLGERLEREYHRTDGTSLFVEGVVFPIRTSQGCMLASITRDITERYRSRVALKEYADRLGLLHEIDQAILVIWSLEDMARTTLNRVRQLIPCEQICLTLFRAEGDQVRCAIIHPNGEATMPQDVCTPREQDCFFPELRGGQRYVIEDIQAMPSPSPLLQWLLGEGVHTYVSMPLMVRGELVGALNLGIKNPSDLTPKHLDVLQELAPALAVAIEQVHLRQQLSETLQQVQQDYASLVDSIDGIVWEADAGTLQISFISRRAERLLGYPVERWTSEATFWQDHLHPEDRDWAPALCLQLTAQKQDHELEYRMLAADGRVVWLRDIVSVIVEDGQPTRLRGVMVDITEKKKAQETLLETERLAAMGTMSASLAHEINNPLQSIVGCLGLAEEALAEGRNVGRYLQVARDEVQRLRRIMGQMRDVYQPVAGERSEVDLNDLLARVIALEEQAFRERRVQVHWQPRPDLPPLLVNADRIQQVFWNLLLNAVEAMPTGGTLQIRAIQTKQPAGVEIEFRDSGPGLAPQARDHLFEPFRSTKPTGSGLGLFISYSIIREHGGTITADSQPGQGTAFRVWLPCLVDTPPLNHVQEEA